MTRHGYSSGFTLLELIVVITLISMMLSFTLPRLQESLFSGGKKKVFRTLILKIKALKENAVIDQRMQTLHVDLDTDSIWISHEAMTEEELSKEKENRMRLPGSLSIADVVFPGKGVLAQGMAEIGFYKKGYSDHAVIHLLEGEETYSSLVIEPFLSGIKLMDGYLQIE